jgi:hypothetical protein
MGASANSVRSGGCLCRAVRFTAVPSKPHMDVCHCGMCRRWSGGVFMSVPVRDLKIENEAGLGVYSSSEWAERLFCKSCGSSLVWRMKEEEADLIAVSYQSLDDQSGLVFEQEIFIDEKPALYAFAGDRPRKTGAEVMAEFAPGQA